MGGSLGPGIHMVWMWRPLKNLKAIVHYLGISGTPWFETVTRPDRHEILHCSEN